MAKNEIALYDASGDPTKQWYVWIRVDGGKRKFCGDMNRGNPSLAEKRARADKLMAELSNADELPEKKPNRLPAEIERLLNALDNHAHRLRPRTRQVFKGKLQKMGQWLVERGKRTFTKELAEEFVNDLGKKLHETTVKEYINTAIWAYKRAGLRCPFAKVMKPRNQKTPAQYFTASQKALLKRECQDKPLLWRAVQLLYFCLIRPNEMRHLRVADVLVQEQRIIVRAENAKNKRTQYVVIPDAFMDEVESWELWRYPGEYYVLGEHGKPAELPIGRNRIVNDHASLLRRCGFDQKRYKFYSWKHTGAVDFVRNGGSVKELQLQMRHHSLDQTDAYLRQLGVMDMESVKTRMKPL